MPTHQVPRPLCSHQGIYLDADGSLLNNDTLPNGTALPNASYHNWTLPAAGATFHSDVGNRMFDDRDCIYLPTVRKFFSVLHSLSI
jgi:hypothetical protein